MQIRNTGFDPNLREVASTQGPASSQVPVADETAAPVVRDSVSVKRGSQKTVKPGEHMSGRKAHASVPPAASEEPKATAKAEAKPEAKPEGGTSLVRFKAQDDLLPDKQIEIPRADIGKALDGPRFKVEEDPNAFRPPVADKDGNYIFRLDDPRQGSVNAYVSAYKALNVAEKFLGRPVEWGHKREVDAEHLWIHPHAAPGLNAFYNSQNGSLNFLYAEDPHTNSLIDSSTSLEVVTHETGHAILDGLRPNYLQSLDAPSSGFHEAFSDVIAMLSALSEDDVVEGIYKETGGDLSQPNMASRMGEMLGRALRGPKNPFVRNSLNDQKYHDSHFLPYFSPSGPALEPHQYAGVWTGASYDILRLLTAGEQEDPSKTFVDAVKTARDTLGQLTMRSLEFSPLGKTGYKEAAIAMLKADAIDFDGQHMKELLGVFSSRDILTQDDMDKFATDLGLTGQIKKADKFKLPAGFNPAADAKTNGGQQFLEKQGPLLGLTPEEISHLKYERTLTNDRGERILHFSESQKVTLTEAEWGASYQGNSFEINGGLLLAFDKEGDLVTFNRDAITEDNVADAKHYLKKMIDFERNPPFVKSGGGDDSDGKSKDPHMDYLLASTRKPIEVVNGQIKRSGIVY